MTAAIDEWLSARKRFLADRREGVDAYCTANLRLLAAFASDWNADDPTMFAKAYQSFKARLIAEANREAARKCNEA